MKSTCETHSHTAANDIDDIRIRSGPKSDSKIYTKEYLWSCEIANSLIYCLGFTYALISVWAHWFCHKGICHTTILITCFYRPQPQGNRAQCRMHIAQIILWINYIIRCRSLVSLAFDQRSVYCFHTQNECIFIIEKHKKKKRKWCQSIREIYCAYIASNCECITGSITCGFRVFRMAVICFAMAR